MGRFCELQIELLSRIVTHMHTTRTTTEEPSALEVALMERYCILGERLFGPLTAEQQDNEDSYIAHEEEMLAEHEREQAHGGREKCQECGEYAIKRTIVEARRDPTVYRNCENCGWHGF